MTSPEHPRSPAGDGEPFDQALGIAARSLVMAPLPDAILDASPAHTSRSWLDPGRTLGPFVAIVVIAVVAGLGLRGPRGLETGRVPAAAQAAPIRSESQVTSDLRGLGFACRTGPPAVTGELRMDAIVCTRDVGANLTTVIVSDSSAREVGEIHVRVEGSGTPTTAQVREGWNLLKQASSLPFGDPAAATAVRGWLDGALPVGPKGMRSTWIGGIPVVLQHEIGGPYVVVLGDLGAAIRPTPSG